LFADGPARDGRLGVGVTGERILLVRLSSLGDVVQCLGALAALRAGRPDAEIAWLVEDRHGGVLEGHPHIDRTFTFERRRGALGAMRRLRAELRAWRPDVAVDLQGNLKSGMLTRLSGAPRRIGLARGETKEPAYLFVNETVPSGPAAEHRAERAMRLVTAIGAKRGVPAAPPSIRPEAVTFVASALAAIGHSRGSFALLVPDTSNYGAFKRWPPARFGGLAMRLREERGMPTLVTYGPGQLYLAEAVVAASDGAAKLAPDTKGVQQLLALLDSAALLVGADSGPVVIAAALGVPTVTLFGPKDPTIYAPRGPRTQVVWKQVYCSPCRLRRCGDPICMTTMEVDDAWDGVLRLGAGA
jgi:ADP-heptose:LPS heptosyltransferase